MFPHFPLGQNASLVPTNSHDKIRHAEQKAKLKGDKPPDMEDSHVAGGAGRESRPTNSTVNVIWEMAERDCRAARYRDVLCDDLEAEDMLGKVKVGVSVGVVRRRFHRGVTLRDAP